MAASAEQIAAVADRLEHVLRRLHAWTDPPPPLQPFRAPFGMDAMPFEHWIQLALLPRMREIARTGAAMPPPSNLAGHAAREFDGRDDWQPLVDVLREVDELCAAPLPPRAASEAHVSTVRLIALAGNLGAVIGVIIAIFVSQIVAKSFHGYFSPTVSAAYHGTVAPGPGFAVLRLHYGAKVHPDGTLEPLEASILLNRREIPMPGKIKILDPLTFPAARAPATESVARWLAESGVDPKSEPLPRAAQEILAIHAIVLEAQRRSDLDETAARLPPGSPEPQIVDIPGRVPSWISIGIGVGAALVLVVPFSIYVIRLVRRRLG